MFKTDPADTNGDASGRRFRDAQGPGAPAGRPRQRRDPRPRRLRGRVSTAAATGAFAPQGTRGDSEAKTSVQMSTRPRDTWKPRRPYLARGAPGDELLTPSIHEETQERGR